MIESKLLKDIEQYCSLNGLEVNTLINKLLRDGFNKMKYGESPMVKPKQVVIEPVKKVEEIIVNPVEIKPIKHNDKKSDLYDEE